MNDTAIRKRFDEADRKVNSVINNVKEHLEILYQKYDDQTKEVDTIQKSLGDIDKTLKAIKRDIAALQKKGV